MIGKLVVVFAGAVCTTALKVSVAADDAAPVAKPAGDEAKAPASEDGKKAETTNTTAGPGVDSLIHTAFGGMSPDSMVAAALFGGSGQDSGDMAFLVAEDALRGNQK